MENNFFDGKKIRDEIIKELAEKVVAMDQKPIFAVLLLSDDPVCASYVELKKKMAEKIGVTFNIYKFNDIDSEDDIVNCIHFLDCDEEVAGVMIQIPVSKKFNGNRLIEAISEDKDVDGLRYCLELNSNFKPPVVLSILRAIEESGRKLEDSKVVIIGHGFLVGSPLERTIKYKAKELVVVNSQTQDLAKITKTADILISAVGAGQIIKPEMIKEGAVLIDAGTTEMSGSLVGDIDPESYKKASFYTPVPGGIGPVTAAMLFKNLIK